MNPHDRWFDGIAPYLIRCAARRAPPALSERLEEEWLADLAGRLGTLSQLSFALGCCWATNLIAHEFSAPVRAAAAATVNQTPVVDLARYVPSFSRRAMVSRSTALAARDNAMCEINTTPLIDVMLVLLVTLIITLPIMTHAVKMDLPQTPPYRDQNPPEVIDLDIDFDGAIVWNGTAVANTQQLESFLRAEAQKDPQPEIHLRADRRVKYDFVAKVLASAQHNRIRKMGFADTAEFKE